MKKTAYLLVILLLLIVFILSGRTDYTSDRSSLRNSFALIMRNSSLIDDPELKEISGLASSEDGRLFCHNDETGIVYEVDRKEGKIIKKFFPGNKIIKADFEGIAIADDEFYMVTSSGEIYEFSEGEDNAFVGYKFYDTGLPAKCDIEGLCYDPETDCLLLACKGYPGKGYEGSKAVYSFSLNTKSLIKEPRFLLSEKLLKKQTGEKNFYPSGIERNPVTGTFLIISARAKAIIEISGDGEILGHAELDKKVHDQPEGITFTQDLNILISDEGRKSGKLTLYKKTKS
ncbi:MAG: SdiA-regulated domain-containing protein [Calditrichaceae bacterium]